MASDNDEKRRIVEELERTRGDLAGAGVELRGQLDFQRRLSVAWQKNRWVWLSLIGLFGWVLSRLPRRTKKIYLDKGGTRVRPPTRSLASTIAGQLWSVAWSMAKPALTAYLAGKMGRTGRSA
ncbi:MAG TPA: hypothetical protein VN939_03920 [Chthoniobacterales bacterium]|jgi:hypothetical protein|nr:hypothetical protein [Chthoniobacterales bacterium]